MDPFSIAAAGIGGIGNLFKGITGFFAGNAQADLDRNAAQQAQMEAGVNAQIGLMQGNRVAASGAVRAAANGGGFVGSSMGVIADLSNQAMFNAHTAIYRGATAAQQDLYNASVAKTQGLDSLVGGVLSAAGSVTGDMMRSSQMSQIAMGNSGTFQGGDGVGGDSAGNLDDALAMVG